MTDSHAENQTSPSAAPQYPPWSECDLFCINGYAGAGKAACGWRGLTRDTRRNEAESKLACPRCGCTTLFRVPPNSADSH
jgi:hypothetical protein